MTYRLIELTVDASPRTVGDYPDYPSALQARIDDVIVRLRGNAGGRIRIEHAIIGPGADGPRTSHPFCTAIGIEENGGQAALEEAQAWLQFAHGLADQPSAPTD